MTLQQPTYSFIENILIEYKKIEGDELNDKLQKLFYEYSDDKDKYDVFIKVAALNKIYSTAITNINPVVYQINKIARIDEGPKSIDAYINLVDKISKIEWANDRNENFKRNNLSFASKYIHFSSNRQIPIYDSYIWIVIKGYLGQKNQREISFTNPKNYKEFYTTFCNFKNVFGLDKYSNYKIDKFLWTYGRRLIKSIEAELGINLNRAKSELKRLLKNHIPS